MFNWPLIYKLLRDLKQRFGTLLALIFVLAIGVSSFSSMAGVYRDMDDARAVYYQRYNLADFTLDLKRAPEAVISQVSHLPNISRLRTRIKEHVMVELPASTLNKQKKLLPGVISSLPVPRKAMINDVKSYRGTWFSSGYAREVMLDEQFARANKIYIGNRIKVRLPDEELNLLVVGTVFSPEYVTIIPPGSSVVPDPSGYAVMYAPRQFLQERSNLKGSFNQLLGMTKDHSKIAIENTMALLSDKLENYGVFLQIAQADQVSVQVLRDELANVERMTTIFPSLFLLIAVLVLNVMMNRLVTQQRTTIGTLKAIGYGNAAIIRHYLGYGLAVGFVGGVFGILLGFGLQNLTLMGYRTYFALPNVYAHVYFDIILIGVLISIFSAVLGSVSGTWHAIKLQPAEAMRPPAPEKGTHIFLERFKDFWDGLTFQSKMVVRAIFRNRFRSFVTITASILATAIVFSSLEFMDSIDKMVSFTFEATQHQDYTLSFREPLGQDIMRHVAIIPGVKSAEGQLNVAARLQHGPYYKLMNISGLPYRHDLYTPLDKKEQPIQVTPDGLVINQTLANMLNVKVGDEITLRPLIGNRMVKKVEIKKIITTYLGLSAYANQAWLSQLIGNSWVTTQVLFKMLPNQNLNAFHRAVNKFATMINLVSLTKTKDLFIITMEQFLVFFIVIMILFAGVIAMGSIINTAMISLNERERDVASLRVIGFTNFQVARIFFGESFILNCIGIFIGLFVGIGFTYAMSLGFSTEIFRMPVVIRSMRLAQTVLIMLLFVLISQAVIYRIIVKMNWYAILNTRE